MEMRVTDRAVDVLEACERYWARTHVPLRAIEEMKTELASHLSEAQSHGRSVEDVVGADLSTFAEAWATEHRPGHRSEIPTWDEVHDDPNRGLGVRFFTVPNMVILGGALVAAWGIATLMERGGRTVDNEMWRWIWVGAAGVLGFAEILTAGFFMLPFAVGAAIAAVLAWIGVGVGIQWAAFLVVSVASLLYLRRFVPNSDDQPPIGANRMVNQRGLVIEGIDRIQATGKVRVDREEWRATTEGEPISEGSEVVVRGVTGTRLIVESVE